MDFRDWIRQGKSKEILKDLEVYFPDQYEEFMKQKEESKRKIPAILRADIV